MEGRLRRHRLGKLAGGGSLAAKVELARRPALEGGNDEARLEPCDLAAATAPVLRLDLGGGPFVGLDRAGELFLDAGTQHLHRDRAAIGGDGAVDLRDRGSADRHRIEAGEHRLDRTAEAGLDLRTDRLERKRRQRILQAEEIERGLVTDDVGAGGERLAELDRGGAERLEGVGVARLIGHRGTDAR